MTILWRTRFWWFVALPWVGLYYIAAAFGVPRDAFHPGLAFEPLPVWPWTSLFYFSEYPAVAAVPLLVTAADRFRKLMIHCWISIAIAFLFYFTLPSIAPRPPVPQDAFLGPFLAWERGNYPASVAFPSFHVIWAVLIAYAAASPQLPRWARLAWWGWAIAVCISCVTTGMHWISDIAAGLAVCWAAIRYESAWAWLTRATRGNPAWAFASVALAMLLRRMWVLDTAGYLIAAVGLGLPLVTVLGARYLGRRFSPNAPATLEAISRLLGSTNAKPLPAEYIDFLRRANGGEGFLGDHYVVLWRAEDLLEFNKKYQAPELAPELFLIGSDGAGEAYAFDQSTGSSAIYRVPLIGMEYQYIEKVAGSFSSFVAKRRLPNFRRAALAELE